MFEGRYVFFILLTDDAEYHTRVLRYDTQGDFTAPGSRRLFMIGGCADG